MGAFLRKYATATASGTHVGIPMIKAGVQDFATGSDWTPANGDVKVSIDDGTQANITNLPAYTNGQWIFQFTLAETTGKSIRVAIVDAATKAVEDQFFVIETFGHASAMFVFDFSSASVLITPGTGTGQLSVSAGIIDSNLVDSNGAPIINGDGTASAVTSTTITLDASDPHRLLSNVGAAVRMGTSDAVITASDTSTGVQTFASWNGGTPSLGVYSITGTSAGSGGGPSDVNIPYGTVTSGNTSSFVVSGLPAGIAKGQHLARGTISNGVITILGPARTIGTVAFDTPSTGLYTFGLTGTDEAGAWAAIANGDVLVVLP